mmetsp:Transcript_10589/g.38931  ORF Transcript_10589/g.38931 Transcript_10589/m.38931 type:complete len:1063 (-) Transcript_10589:155-3343(-)|eukprot:scaffold2911_cov414-Prasinococcus_capsulatus_cf.AAC.49
MGRNATIARTGRHLLSRASASQATGNTAVAAIRGGLARQVVAESERAFTSLAEAPTLAGGLRSAGARAVLPGITNAVAASLASGSADAVPRAAWAAVVRKFATDALAPLDTFQRRHNSITEEEAKEMAQFCGFESLDALIDATVPAAIRREPMQFPAEYQEGMTESAALAHIKAMADSNVVKKSLIGQGYYGTKVPPVILRNLVENPGWYTQYTPYQAEISQGRLESLLNFQTMVTNLTGLPLSNASLLDEATAAAEAMTMCSAVARGKKPRFLVADDCFSQTIEVCKTRADGLGLEVIVAKPEEFEQYYAANDVCGVLMQYPTTFGTVPDFSNAIEKAKAAKVKVVMSCDLLALTLMKPPGELGADIAVGSSQRFGVPMGYGGPHAAFLATSHEYKRLMPGRIIGVAQDANGDRILRMAMQTREQHIRRDKATSNICTAQALLANVAAMYGVYHGPEGLKKIATRCHTFAKALATALSEIEGLTVDDGVFFDTVTVRGVTNAYEVENSLSDAGLVARKMGDDTFVMSMDETLEKEDLLNIVKAFAGRKKMPDVDAIVGNLDATMPDRVKRDSPFMTHDVFNKYHTEHEMLRYMMKLQSRDLSLVHSMIPLGSCTMKLNSTSEMIPITWEGFANMHPYAPPDQAKGYMTMMRDLTAMLAELTGFDDVSLQPNSGATGEYAGLMAIRAYHRSRGDHHRNVCIIPTSAHGTNPASAVMSGMTIVTVGTDEAGNVNIEEVRQAAEANKDKLAALMITYPSTHGVYEEGVDEICRIIHENGGQVYMDGANMNAQVGLTSPGHIGADVCHLNLHKTFCIPHGGGGPGMGPIGVKKHLIPFLSSHPELDMGGSESFGTIAAAPFGSAMILPISYMYCAMMGAGGLTDASKLAILNANYMAKRLEQHYPVLFRGKNGTCAHEFILDTRIFKATSGVEAEDIAKRLMDYGYHAPTMSWPVAGTLMVEPTESESKAELDRFCDAMISIREEISKIEKGEWSIDNNPLKNSPHAPKVVMSDSYDLPYSRETAAYPLGYLKDFKFWPTNGRVDNVYGDRHLIVSLDEDVAATG